MQTQAQAIARTDRAFVGYTAALRELAESQSLYELQEKQLRIIQQSIRAGSDNQLSLDGVQNQLSVLARARLDALGRAQRVYGELEDAVQRPLNHDGRYQIRPDSPALNRLPEHH
jgi:hypothetical protein